jgi:hypothetical protein
MTSLQIDPLRDVEALRRFGIAASSEADAGPARLR